jgi:hypothetical protein
MILAAVKSVKARGKKAIGKSEAEITAVEKARPPF